MKFRIDRFGRVAGGSFVSLRHSRTSSFIKKHCHQICAIVDERRTQDVSAAQEIRGWIVRGTGAGTDFESALFHFAHVVAHPLAHVESIGMYVDGASPTAQNPKLLN
jgi:hypothetical protein